MDGRKSSSEWTRRLKVPKSGNWSDAITVHMDATRVSHIDFQIKEVPSFNSMDASIKNGPHETVTRVSNGIAGARPKLELKHGESATVLDMTPTVEQTFFQKYWMYLLIGGLFMLISGGGGGEQGAAEEGRADAKK